MCISVWSMQWYIPEAPGAKPNQSRLIGQLLLSWGYMFDFAICGLVVSFKYVVSL